MSPRLPWGSPRLTIVTDLPPLIVDDRQDGRFTKALRQHFTVTVKHLSSGDLVWTSPLGRVGVEDKDLKDLASSLRNHRLDDELRRLVATYAIPVLLIRGGGAWADRYMTLEEQSIEKLKVGRQLHGVYVYHVSREMNAAAEGLRELYDYLAYPSAQGIDGVNREKVLRFRGPLSLRAEAIYGILGMLTDKNGKRVGVRDRRNIAQAIAKDATLSQFLSWTPFDFENAGFSRHMSGKLYEVLRQLEVQP